MNVYILALPRWPRLWRLWSIQRFTRFQRRVLLFIPAVPTTRPLSLRRLCLPIPTAQVLFRTRRPLMRIRPHILGTDHLRIDNWARVLPRLGYPCLSARLSRRLDIDSLLISESMQDLKWYCHIPTFVHLHLSTNYFHGLLILTSSTVSYERLPCQSFSLPLPADYIVCDL